MLEVENGGKNRILQTNVEKTGNKVKIKSNAIKVYISILYIFNIKSIIAELICFKEENLHVGNNKIMLYMSWSLCSASCKFTCCGIFHFFSFPILCEA